MVSAFLFARASYPRDATGPQKPQLADAHRWCTDSLSTPVKLGQFGQQDRGKKLLNMARCKTQESTRILGLSNFCLTVIPSLNHSQGMGLTSKRPQQPSSCRDAGTGDSQCILAAFLEIQFFKKNLYINVTKLKAAGR